MNALTLTQRLNAPLMVALIVNLGAVADEARSFLVNGDFEEGTGAGALGWSCSFYPGRKGIEDCVGRSDARARSGRWSFKIDTQAALGEEVALVYNGVVSAEATRLRGRTLALSGWIYVESGSALRPMHMRVRTFGKDKEGKGTFIGDVLDASVLGRPGEWAPFRFSGVVPDAEITTMDLHCSVCPDMVRTIQFLDDLRLELSIPPPFEMRLLRDAVWRDEAALPVEVHINKEKDETQLAFTLVAGKGKVAARWERPPRTGIVGLALSTARLLEGRYLLRGELRDDKGSVLASAETPLEVATSPWEDAPQSRRRATARRPCDETPGRFQVAGSVAPTDAPDVITTSPEMTSPDLDLTGGRKRGYVVFSRHYLDRVSRLGRPRPGEFDTVRLFACPGEYEPATISVWALCSEEDVRVRVSDLTGERGTIAASSVEVRVVRTPRGLPAFLEKRQTVDIPEGQTQTFWLTVRVPPDARSGFYRGDIEVAPQSGETTCMPLLLRVLPLELPPPQKLTLRHT